MGRSAFRKELYGIFCVKATLIKDVHAQVFHIEKMICLVPLPLADFLSLIHLIHRNALCAKIIK